MVISEVGYVQIVERLRLDAEFYKPEYIVAERVLKKIKSVQLRDIVTFSTFRRNPGKEPIKQFQYIDISNIDIFAGDISLQTMKGFQAPSRARKVIRENDIIISTVRPNRNAVAIIPKELDGQICSTGFAVIKAQGINTWFLFAFLKSKYAISQLVRMTMASMYPAISEEDIGSILVCVPPLSLQQKIEFIVKESIKKRKTADEKYRQAEDLLNKILNVDNLDLEEEKVFESRFDELTQEQRIDADFYKPKFKLALNILNDGNKKRLFTIGKLGDIAKLSKGIEVGSDSYTEKGYLFLRVSNLTEKEIVISDSAEYIRENLYNDLKSKYKPDTGEILYTKDATVGIAFPVSKDLGNCLISSGIVRIKPDKEFDPYYLSLVLNCFICRSIAERHCIGAVIKHYNYSEIKDLLIPLIPKEKQEEIAELVKQAFIMRRESKSLLDHAKKEVENIIENRSK